MINFEDFLKVDIRVGTIIESSINEKAKKPAYKLKIDFGSLGIKTSSAQITDVYQPEDLLDKQIVAVVNFPPRQVANVISEVLVLGTESKDGIILLVPDKNIENGSIIS